MLESFLLPWHIIELLQSISASLGLSLRSGERLNPAGNGLGPKNRENKVETRIEGEVKQDSVLRNKR